MTTPLKIFLAIFRSGLILFCTLNLLACGAGTETGNPRIFPPTANDPDSGVLENSDSNSSSGEPDNMQSDDDGDVAAPSSIEYTASDLLIGFCDRVDDCSLQRTSEFCQSELNQNENFIAAFGSSEASFESIDEAIEVDIILVDQDDMAACLEAIESLSCSELAQVISGVGQNTDYGDAWEAVPDDC